MIEAANCAYDVDDTKGASKGFCPRIGVADEVVTKVGGEITPGTKHYRDAAYAARYSNVAIIAFRGTLPIALDDTFWTAVLDWANDTQAKLDPVFGYSGDNLVHTGFVESLDNTAGPIFHAVGKWYHDKTIDKIYVTGHSKGGAMAVIAALRLRQTGLPLAGVYTFAAARAGSQKFVERYAKAMEPAGAEAAPVITMRYENEGDVVPHLPPTQDEIKRFRPIARNFLNKFSGKYDYESVGELTYIQADGRVITPPDTAAAEALEKQRMDRFLKNLGARGVTDLEIVKGLGPNHGIEVATKPDPDSERYYRTVCGVSAKNLPGSYQGDK